MIICQDCQTPNPTGTLMCNQCLMPLPKAAQNQFLAASPKSPQIRWLRIENLQPTGDSLYLPNLNYQGEILIGRNDLAQEIIVDLDLSDLGGQQKKISRKHARLIFENNQVFIEDWESQFGIFVNKSKLTKGQRQLLNQGDEIRLAELAFLMEVL